MKTSIPGLQVSFHQDQIDVTDRTGVPDPGWRATDSSGFIHCWDMDPDHPVVQTYIWITDMEADDEYPETGHWESCFTGEKMPSPGRLVTGKREFIGGLQHYTFVATPEYEYWDGLVIHANENLEKPVAIIFAGSSVDALITDLETYIEGTGHRTILNMRLISTGPIRKNAH